MINALRYGLQPLKEDKRDFVLGAIFRLPDLDELPEEFEIPEFDIFNQIDDYCSSTALAGMKAIVEEKLPFYPALFAISKQISGDPDSWGQNMRDAFKAAKVSVPMYEDAPEFLKKKLVEGDSDFLRRIENYPQDFIDSGKKYRNKSFFKVTSLQYDAFDTARASIWRFRAKKQTIAIGLPFSWPLTTQRLTGTSTQGFGHMMFLNGWTKDDNVVVNSYGRGAGKDGKHLISRETINAFEKKYGMFMSVDLDPEKARIYIERAKWTLAGFWGKMFIILKKYLWLP